MTKYYIYKITCLANNRVYIGQTKHLKKRKAEHLRSLKNQSHHSTLLQRSWNKYGKNLFKHEIIEECDINNVDEKEVYWIKFHDSTNKYNGFNNDGGGNKNKVLSEVTRQKISKFHRERYEIAKIYLLSENAMKKKSVKLSGKNNPMYGKTPREWMDKQTYEKWVKDKSARFKGENNPMFGKPVSDERKAKYSELFTGEGNPFYGRSHTEETKEKIRQVRFNTIGNKRSVHCITTGQTFKTITEASLLLSIDGSSISKVCRNKLQQAKGYKFEYI